MNALAVGAGLEQLEFIKAAKGLGWKVFAVDKNPLSIGFSYADQSACIDIADESWVIRYAEEHKIALTLPSPVGRYLTTVGAVNSALGLLGVSREMASLCTDKVKLNSFLRANRIPCAKQEVVYDSDALTQTIKAFDCRCVVKPRFGSGSAGVTAVTDISDMDTAVKESLAYLKDGVLVENILDGIEYGLDIIFLNGGYTLLAARKKWLTRLPYRQEVGYINTPFPDIKALDAALKPLARLVENRRTMCNIDLMFYQGMVYIIELAFRAPGYNILYKMLPRILDMDIISAALLSCYTGELKDISAKRTVGLFFWDIPSGVLAKVPEARALNALPQIIEYDIRLKQGDTTSEIKTGRDALERGYMLIEGSSEEEILSIKDKILNMFKVEVKDGYCAG
jgi:phosphoribosylamine-glycine ligase